MVSLDGVILEGELPTKQKNILLGWVAIHEEELNANWEMLQRGEGYFKQARTDGFTVIWPDGQDICPDELYENSKV